MNAEEHHRRESMVPGQPLGHPVQHLVGESHTVSKLIWIGDCDPGHEQAAADLDMNTEAGLGKRVGSVDRGLVNIRLTRAYEVPHDI